MSTGTISGSAEFSTKSRAVSSVPKLLVSVRDVREAEIALEGGADWIDLKEPLEGALGAVEANVARQVAERIAQRKPLSAALGELIDWPTSNAQKLLEIEGIGVVKLGLAGCAAMQDWQGRWQSAAESVSNSQKSLVAVAYADWRLAQAPLPQEVIACSQANGGKYLLIDTFAKQAGSVLDHCSGEELRAFLQLAKSAGLQTVVAGSLLPASLAWLPPTGIDLVAVRGAVCEGERTEAVSRELVKGFRAAMAHRWLE